jgi:hypothetical protein
MPLLTEHLFTRNPAERPNAGIAFTDSAEWRAGI